MDRTQTFIAASYLLLSSSTCSRLSGVYSQKEILGEVSRTQIEETSTLHSCSSGTMKISKLQLVVTDWWFAVYLQLAEWGYCPGIWNYLKKCLFWWLDRVPGRAGEIIFNKRAASSQHVAVFLPPTTANSQTEQTNTNKARHHFSSFLDSGPSLPAQHKGDLFWKKGKS